MKKIIETLLLALLLFSVSGDAGAQARRQPHNAAAKFDAPRVEVGGQGGRDVERVELRQAYGGVIDTIAARRPGRAMLVVAAADLDSLTPRETDRQEPGDTNMVSIRADKQHLTVYFPESRVTEIYELESLAGVPARDVLQRAELLIPNAVRVSPTRVSRFVYEGGDALYVVVGEEKIRLIPPDTTKIEVSDGPEYAQRSADPGRPL